MTRALIFAGFTTGLLNVSLSGYVPMMALPYPENTKKILHFFPTSQKIYVNLLLQFPTRMEEM